MMSQVFPVRDSSIGPESWAIYGMCPWYGFWEVGRCELSGGGADIHSGKRIEGWKHIKPQIEWGTGEEE